MTAIAKIIVDKPGDDFGCTLEFGGVDTWILYFQETIIGNYGAGSLTLVKINVCKTKWRYLERVFCSFLSMQIIQG